jgi:uncharacterized protein (DUF1501 family)
MIARLIDKRNYTNPTLGSMNNARQIYFASVGGYDLHGGQVDEGDASVGPHANLLRELSQSMYAFQKAMEFLNLADQVVTFTMSDFGRTFPTNGDGSDHGWGNHQLVMGGTGGGSGLVNGKRLFGPFPQFTINGNDDHSTGRWIPKFSVDQYAGHLAQWFGVTNTDLNTVFPNLSRFPFDLANTGADGLNFLNDAAGPGLVRPATRAPLTP